jgi:hypothetical protein
MNSTVSANHPTPDWHILILHDQNEKDILGVWGPYTSSEHAALVLEELRSWPLDGIWTMFRPRWFHPQDNTTTKTSTDYFTWQH